MAETPDSGVGAAAAPAPTTAAASTPRGQRQQLRQRRNRGVILALAAVGAAAFTAVVVWLATSEPPYVTHREVMVIAAAIENAQSLDELRQFVRPDAPAPILLPAPPTGEPAADIASIIWGLKSKAHYTFLGGRDEQTQRPRLLFRASSDTMLFDYQELRLARDASVVKVVDLYAMTWDRWCSELQRERERLADALQGPQVAALREAIASHDAAAALAAHKVLPDAVRASMLFTLELLAAFPADERVYTELRAQHQDSLALGFAAVVRAQQDNFANKPSWLLDAAYQALARIDARTDDDAWGTSLRSALLRAGAKK